MKSTKTRHVFACLLCILLVFLAVSPASAVSFDTQGFFTTLDVKENGDMHVTEEIYVDFQSEAHGIFRYIPKKSDAYYVQDGELQSKRMVYAIKNVECAEAEVDLDSEDDQLIIRLGSADKTVTGMNKYTLEYDIQMYEDGIPEFDELYWNVKPPYWDTDIEFFGFTVIMPKAFGKSEAEVISGAVGTGDTQRASWTFTDDTRIDGYIENLEWGEAVTVRIILPEGYWTGMRSEKTFVRTIQGIMGALTAFVVGLFLVKGRDPKAVKTVEFYPPDGLPSAEVGYIYDAVLNEKDMTSMVMWFASKGYLKIHAQESALEKGILNKKPQVHITLEKLQELPDDAPEYQRKFFNALFRKSRYADLEELSKLTSFADDYEEAKKLLSDMYSDEKGSSLQEGYGNMAIGCLSGILAFGAFLAGVFLVHAINHYIFQLLGTLAICAIVIIACCVNMSRPTPYRQQMLGRIKGFREFIQMAELDRVNQLVEQDPDYFYNILPYAYVFDLTDKWSKNFDKLAAHPPTWYEGPPAIWYEPAVFYGAMDRSVNRSLSDSSIHTTSAQSFSSSGSHSSGGGGFSGGGGGGGGGGGW
ncbi:MAG: DUF2207 domain-containing protein [Clostridia bacterium]|nr:DUF2207 domain-containing protein [Clostridia bacterium]